MQAPAFIGPPFAQMLGNLTFDLPREPGPGNRHLDARFQEPGEVIQV